ncbi:MAG: hypothetical protein AB4058_07260 [Microcystaceae cyanobacterium]
MLSDSFIIELKSVLQTQNSLLQQIEDELLELEEKLSDVDEQTQQLQALEKMMAELEASIDYLEADDFEDFDITQISKLYENHQQSISKELIKIGYQDWTSFVRQCQIYTLERGIDPLTPYESLLTQSDLDKLKNESYDAQYQWDQFDYIAVGTSGILAALTDVFLVAIPQNINSGKFTGQLGSPLTAWLKQYNTHQSNDWFAQWAKTLEKECKTPYDHPTIFEGMGGRTHRFQSLGHDPILGFIFGILDIMRGTITGFYYDNLTNFHQFQCQPVSQAKTLGLIEAFLCHLGHLISDVATPMGLPAPFLTLMQAIDSGSFGEKNRTVAEVARWMYLNGYDFRHFLITGISPAVIEITLRAYMMLRHYSEQKDWNLNMISNPKYRTMLLSAHGIATLANAGKITLMQGNPLAINYAQWLACVRYLVPSLKYWIFDQHQLKLDHLEKINTGNWDNLLNNSDKILKMVTQSSEIIYLG